MHSRRLAMVIADRDVTYVRQRVLADVAVLSLPAIAMTRQACLSQTWTNRLRNRGRGRLSARRRRRCRLPLVSSASSVSMYQRSTRANREFDLLEGCQHGRIA